VRVGNFYCVQYADNSVQLIYNRSVRCVEFGRRADGEILARLKDGSVFTADKNGTLTKI
jgi:hypothetical protein